MLKGTTKVVGTAGQLFRYDIEVENGITGVDLAAFATLVDSDARRPAQLVRARRAPAAVSTPARSTSTSRLTSSMTVRKYCGYDIPVETSCYATARQRTGLTVNRVVFNDARWVRGASAYVGDLTAYRIYMINHEDGHALGHQHAHQCLPGGLAPVMMQQTIGLKSAITGRAVRREPVAVPAGREGRAGCRAAGHDRRTTSTTSATDPRGRWDVRLARAPD